MDNMNYAKCVNFMHLLHTIYINMLFKIRRRRLHCKTYSTHSKNSSFGNQAASQSISHYITKFNNVCVHLGFLCFLVISHADYTYISGMHVSATNCTEITILTLTQTIINNMEYCIMSAYITPKTLQDLINIKKRTCLPMLYVN
jgi:hypothetical protein